MEGTAFVRVGRVARTHGLKGEVSAVPTAGLPFDILVGCELWFVPPGEGLRQATLTSVRQGPKGPLLSLGGVEDADEAALLRGKDIMVRTSDVPQEFLEIQFDPVGLEVIDDLRGPLGSVEDVIVTGANDVWVVEGERFGQVLVPVIEQVVHKVDRDARTAYVHLLPGLIEDE